MAWEWLGGGFTTGPAACSWAPGRLDLFGRGEDSALWHGWFTNGAWHVWESLVSAKARADMLQRG